MRNVKDIGEVIRIADRESAIYELLRGCPLKILKEFSVVTSSRGEFVLEQGRVYQSIFIVVSGVVAIYILSADGRKYAISVCKRGSFIGEHEIFDGKPYSSQVEAISDVTLLEIKRAPFLEWMELDRNFCDLFIRGLCRQMYSLTQKAGTDTLYSLRARICRFLVSAPVQSNNIQVSRVSLGELMGVTGRSVSRILKSLQDSGAIRCEPGRIAILDIEALRRESDE